MTLATPAAPLTVTLSASGLSTTIYVDNINFTTDTRKFERKEFSNLFLLNLPEGDGSTPVFIKNAVGKPVQLNFNCSQYTARDVKPDDSQVQNILRKFVVKTFTLTGGPTPPSAINQLVAVAQDHKERLASFEAYQDRFGLTLSYLYFYGFRNSTFSYLTSTGLTLSGGELMSENNVLIRNFDSGTLHSNPTNQTITTKNWNIVCDVLTIEAADIYN